MKALEVKLRVLVPVPDDAVRQAQAISEAIATLDEVQTQLASKHGALMSRDKAKVVRVKPMPEPLEDPDVEPAQAA